MSDETLKQNSDTQAILQAIAELSNKIDSVQSELSNKIDSVQNELNSFKKETNARFESIREGIVLNSARFDRLEARILNLNADFTELSEEIRQSRKALSLK